MARLPKAISSEECKAIYHPVWQGNESIQSLEDIKPWNGSIHWLAELQQCTSWVWSLQPISFICSWSVSLLIRCRRDESVWLYKEL